EIRQAPVAGRLLDTLDAKLARNVRCVVAVRLNTRCVLAAKADPGFVHQRRVERMRIADGGADCIDVLVAIPKSAAIGEAGEGPGRERGRMRPTEAPKYLVLG